jgi:hypothetical protein
MKKIFPGTRALCLRACTLFVLLASAFPAVAQSNKERDKILAEAYILYNSERASWHGTDIFLQRYPNLRDKAKGYFSYTENKVHRCVFFDGEQKPNVLFSATFDDSFVVEAAALDTVARKFTVTEADLHTIRQKSLELATTDTLFKHYENTSLNFIPVVSGKEKKVYVLTGPNITGVVVLGNDYLVEFDKKNNITSKRALHKNIIPLEYSKDAEGGTSMHNHQETTGDLITATDVCTLMLYGPYANWQTHMVLSKNNVSIWDCTKNNLVIMTRDAYDKIQGAERDEEKD